MIYIDDDMNIHLTRGDSTTLNVTIYDATGEVYTPAAGDKIIFSIKKIADTPKTLVQIDNGNSLAIQLDNSSTNKLTFGEYIYDVTLKSGSDFYTFIADKRIFIEREVHSTWN